MVVSSRMSHPWIRNVLTWFCCKDPFNLNRVITRIPKKFYVAVRIRTILCHADPGASTVTGIFMMPRGSGHADPGAQNRYQFFMMTRGSGSTDPGIKNVIKKFYDDARIRECGSGRHTSFRDLGAQIFLFGSLSDIWIQKHAVVSVKIPGITLLVPF